MWSYEHVKIKQLGFEGEVDLFLCVCVCVCVTLLRWCYQVLLWIVKCVAKYKSSTGSSRQKSFYLIRHLKTASDFSRHIKKFPKQIKQPRAVESKNSMANNGDEISTQLVKKSVCSENRRTDSRRSYVRVKCHYRRACEYMMRVRRVHKIQNFTTSKIIYIHWALSVLYKRKRPKGTPYETIKT